MDEEQNNEQNLGQKASQDIQDTTNAVKDPKNGVISCWVCTGVMILIDVLRLTMLHPKRGIADWIFLALIVIWIVISVYETVKYIRGKSKNNA